MKCIFVSTCVLFALSGCASLPSENKISNQFANSHPDIEIQKIDYTINESKTDNRVYRYATFSIFYKNKGNSDILVDHRYFHGVPEGWAEYDHD